MSADRAAAAEDRTGGTICHARLRMMIRPDEAITALQAAQPSPPQAWEVDLQRARAETLAGRDDAAQSAMQRAWSEALLAGAEQGAAARVASDMMVAAGRKGDRDRLISLLAVDRLNRGTSTGQEVLSADLPVCGSAGITPDDSVAMEFLRQAPPGRPRFRWFGQTGRVQLLEQSIAVLRAHVPITDPRLMALELRLLSVRREQGDNAAVVELIKRFNFAPDLCSVAVPPVRFTSANITADDYPPDLVQTLLQGRTMLQFSISAAGTATSARVLVSDPPFAFDAVALSKSSTLTYEPAKTAGVSRACRAQVQPIRWQLPY